MGNYRKNGDPTTEIMNGIYKLLETDNEIKFQNKRYHYYPTLKPTDEVDGIRLESLDLESDPDCTGNGWYCNLAFQIITHSYNDYSYELVNGISNILSNLITENVIEMNGFVNGGSNDQTSISVFVEETENYIIIRKLIYFNLLITEE